MADSPYVAALTQLQARANQLEAELTTVRTAIAALASLNGAVSVSPPRASTAPQQRRGSGRSNGRATPAPALDGDQAERIRKALKDGPVSVADFCERSGLSRYTMSQYLTQGVLVATGATTNRRIAWPTGSAKEAL